MKNWSLKRSYRQSWELTKNHKELWILGLVALAYAGGSSGSNFRQNFESSDFAGGSSEETASRFETVGNNIGTLVENVADRIEPSVYVGFGFEFLALIIFGVVWGVIVMSWAQAAVILGVAKARTVKKVSLGVVANQATKYIKPLIWLSVVPALAIVAAILVAVVIAALLGLVHPMLSALVFIILAVVGIYALLRFALSMVWSPRYVVLENMSGREALKAGWDSIAKSLFEVLGLGIVNTLVLGLINVLLLIPLAGVGFAAIWPMIQSQTFEPERLIPVLLVWLITMPLQTLVGAVTTVFRYATWQVAFETLTGKVETE